MSEYPRPANGFGQAAANSTNGFGGAAGNSTNGFGFIHPLSPPHPSTDLVGGSGEVVNYKLDFLAINSPKVTFSDVVMTGDLYFEFECPTHGSNFYILGRNSDSNSYIRLRPLGMLIRWNLSPDITVTTSQGMSGEKIRVERVGSVVNIYLADSMTLIGTAASDLADFTPNSIGVRAGGFLANGQVSYLDLNGQWEGDFTVGSGLILPDTVSGNDGVITGATWENL